MGVAYVIVYIYSIYELLFIELKKLRSLLLRVHQSINDYRRI